MEEELFPLVDAAGRVVGSTRRSEAHGNPTLLHPVVHCLVTDTGGRILLQLRSRSKDVQPGRWDTSVGGHVALGETIEQALMRELKEELGIEPQLTELRFLYRYLMRSEIESELVHTYHLIHEGPFVVAESEIEAARFWSRFEIEAALGSGTLTPNFEDEFARFRALLDASEASSGALARG